MKSKLTIVLLCFSCSGQPISSDCSSNSIGGNSSQCGTGGSTSVMPGKAKTVSVGNGFACSVLNDNTVNCWGYNIVGSLGNGSTIDSFSPTPVSGISTATKVVAGNYIGCAILQDSTVKCWGQNLSGAIGEPVGTDSLYPKQIQISNVIDLAVGYETVFAVLATGSVVCWGKSDTYQCGKQSTPITQPTTVSGIDNVKSISVYGDTICALKNDKTVWCWGNFAESSGSVYAIKTPTQISVTDVSLLANGNWTPYTVNSSGLYKSTSVTESSVVVGISNPTSISGGMQFACAVVNGTIKCWGKNSIGKLGNGTTVDSDVPVNVTGISSASLVSCGSHSSCALQNGHIKCWGSGNHGLLGDGISHEQSTVPVDVLNL